MPINSFEHLKQIERKKQKKREGKEFNSKDNGKNQKLRGFL